MFFVKISCWNFPNRHYTSYHTFGTIGFVMNKGTGFLDLCIIEYYIYTWKFNEIKTKVFWGDWGIFLILLKIPKLWLKGNIKSWVILIFGNLVTSESFEWKWNSNFHLLLNFQTHQEHTQSETQIYIYVFHMWN
jgi:hypothetical protein